MKNGFRKRRLELGLTALEVATMIGVREGTYTKWERFQTVPMSNHVKKIETALQSSWHKLWEE